MFSIQTQRTISGVAKLRQTLCPGAGHLVMGDATYNHVYNGNDSTGSVTQRLRSDTVTQPEEEAEQDVTAGPGQELRTGSMSPVPADDVNLDALHAAIVSNTDGSAAAVAARSPTGKTQNDVLCWYKVKI